MGDHRRCQCGSEDFTVREGVGEFCDFCGFAMERYDTMETNRKEIFRTLHPRKRKQSDTTADDQLPMAID